MAYYINVQALNCEILIQVHYFTDKSPVRYIIFIILNIQLTDTLLLNIDSAWFVIQK